MHDGHVHGSCGDCASFVPAFPAKRDLADWGFCREQDAPPPPAALVVLHEAYRAGDRGLLQHNQLGLYRTAPDDGCDFFRYRDW